MVPPTEPTAPPRVPPIAPPKPPPTPPPSNCAFAAPGSAMTVRVAIAVPSVSFFMILLLPSIPSSRHRVRLEGLWWEERMALSISSAQKQNFRQIFSDALSAGTPQHETEERRGGKEG